MERKVYDEATKVTERQGSVVLDGPDRVDVSMTPEAAFETSNRLLDAATHAKGKQVRAGETVKRS